MNYQNIAITGASSGIGYALALEFAQKGRYLYLCGRNEYKLKEIKQKCEQKGANVSIDVFDITFEIECKKWIEKIFKNRLDLLIANAGIANGNSYELQKDKQMVEVNIIGVLNIIVPSIKFFESQKCINNKCGHIVLMSSMVGIFPLPTGMVYSASKSFIHSYGESLSIALRKNKIAISTVHPGYVDTKLIQNAGANKPLQPSQAAKIIKNGILKLKENIYFPISTKIAAKIYNLMPLWIKSKLQSFLPKEL
ncbi:hypothetical protein BKH44_05185 [Helicobacter sp. 13S00477-4]|nr:hypothetical protein BKH44_05185 [Helicobacter sp. 13S00477-4]